MHSLQTGAEVERIRAAYARRDAVGHAAVHSLFTPAGLFTFQERERRVLAAVREATWPQGLDTADVLEVGCGRGDNLLDLLRYGASPARLHGIDLLQDRIESARAVLGTVDVRCGNAEELPFADASFDLVLCFTVFSSILDHEMRTRVAAEMTRVLRPHGAVLWYDYFMNNPRNPDVRGVRLPMIRAIFDGFDVDVRRVTVAPPLVRIVAPVSRLACEMLARIPFTMTHYVGVLRRRDVTGG